MSASAESESDRLLFVFHDEERAKLAVMAFRNAWTDSQTLLGRMANEWGEHVRLEELEQEDLLVAARFGWTPLAPDLGPHPTDVVSQAETLFSEAGGTQVLDSELQHAWLQAQLAAARSSSQPPPDAWLIEDVLTGIPGLLDDPDQPGDWSARVSAPLEHQRSGTFYLSRDKRAFTGELRAGILRLRPPKRGFLSAILRGAQLPCWEAGDLAGLGAPPPRLRPLPEFVSAGPPSAPSEDKGWVQAAKVQRDAPRLQELRLTDEGISRCAARLKLEGGELRGTLFYEVRASLSKGQLKAVVFCPLAFQLGSTLGIERLDSVGLEHLHGEEGVVIPLVEHQDHFAFELSGRDPGQELGFMSVLHDLVPIGLRHLAGESVTLKRRGRPIKALDHPASGTIACRVGEKGGELQYQGRWRLQLTQSGLSAVSFRTQSLRALEPGDELLEALRAYQTESPLELALGDPGYARAHCAVDWDGRSLSNWRVQRLDLSPLKSAAPGSQPAQPSPTWESTCEGPCSVLCTESGEVWVSGAEGLARFSSAGEELGIVPDVRGAAVLSPDGQRLVATSGVWRTEDWARERTFAPPAPSDTMLMRDGVAVHDQRVVVWRSTTQALTRSLTDSTWVGSVPAAPVAFVGEGQLALVRPQALVVVDWPTMEVCHSFATPALHVLATSPDGRLLAGGDTSGRVYLWDVHDGHLRHVFHADADERAILSLAFSPSGDSLAVGCMSCRVEIFATRDGASRATLVGHSERVVGVAFARDSARLASAGLDGEIKVWPLPD